MESVSSAPYPKTREWPKRVLEGAGFAVLYILPLANAFFKPWHENAYHHAHPVGSIPRAIFLLTLLVWAFAWLAITVADRISPRKRNAVWIVLIVLLVWFLGRIGAGIFDAHPSAVVRLLLAAHIGMAVAPLVLILLWRMRPKVLEQTITAVRALCTISAFGMLILLPKLAWQGLRFEAPDQRSFANPSLSAVSPSEPRIIWILMDELSYNQVFEHPPAGLTFPNLDRFAETSTYFSNLQPSGYHTELVIPGLILGRPVADVEHIYGRPFRFRRLYRGPWYFYDPQQTIFGEAHRLGWTTGIAAWFNPYCRFLPGVLDRCFWQFTDVYPGFPTRLYYDASTLKNLLALLPLHERMDPFAVRRIDHQTHMDDYIGVMKQSEDLLRDPRIRFIMLHLPVPHTPGIYDREHHTLAPAGNYIDNLALADETLGTLMGVIASTPAASQTSIVVSSDHSWRVDDWKKLSDWTPEEQRISGGRFDTRPVLMVHLAGQEQSHVIDHPANAMAVHSILEAMLRGQIHTSIDIEKIDAATPHVEEPSP
jgi:hypothetical protein